MKKKLSEMTLKELWELFPIFLVPHKSEWEKWFSDEKTPLTDLLGVNKIEHIGSTAISTIYAKDIVDIMIIVEENEFAHVVDKLKGNNYILMNQKNGRATFNKGYTPEGFADRVFHIHVRKTNDIDELYFRDFLIEHEDISKAYESLKLKLWKIYEHDRDGYTEAKTEFINNITSEAKILYKNKKYI
ncbi:conserved hypothetical protein (UPF0157) [Alteracholeplasma palmae J233]|uniref:GrpB family protein n=1 Tax=Alteracholeplasma palmae (strain ATCC 49389 / J233) TaxID=1318466 RepID=U4KKZ7_ALTPJ|nr:GrpB family protein [Alteracholeplasma palmae]CCV64383.1 conserved hypothetical protein (UPF0157) [Alteracholeplasma palmae J233]